jgi:FHS family L-fucose permease-like MFS transporter
MDGLGPLRRAGASLIIMAIIGGAVLTGLMGHISDLAGIDTAMLVPAVCFLVVLGFAVKAGRTLSDEAPAVTIH